MVLECFEDAGQIDLVRALYHDEAFEERSVIERVAVGEPVGALFEQWRVAER